MYWWDLVLAYPFETAIFLIILILGYLGYHELSKLWNKPMYISDQGKWRIERYTGRIVKMQDKKLFTTDIPPRTFECLIKIRGQPKRRILLDSRDITEVKSRKIIMNKKYIVWIPELNAYVLTNIRPQAYHLNPENLEALYDFKLTSIDLKANKGAVASPPVIHNSLLQQHLPLEFGQYQENMDENIGSTAKYLFKKEETGDYGTLYEKIQEEDQQKTRPRPRVRETPQEEELLG